MAISAYRPWIWCSRAGSLLGVTSGPPHRSSSALVAAAETRGLLLAAGGRFGTGHALDDRLRVPYTQPVEVIERAVQLLTKAAADLPVGAAVTPDRQVVI